MPSYGKNLHSKRENSNQIKDTSRGLCRSAVLWEEMKKKGRWRTLNLKYCDELEEAWARVEKATAVGAEPNYRHKIGDMEVNGTIYAHVFRSAI